MIVTRVHRVGSEMTVPTDREELCCHIFQLQSDLSDSDEISFSQPSLKITSCHIFQLQSLH